MGQFDKLNQLEKRAFQAEESASEVRWDVADEIVRLLSTGKTQAQVAEGWVNLKTGKPYSVKTVERYSALVRKNPAGSGRSTWIEAYYEAYPSTGTEARMERNLAQLPKNEEGLYVTLERAAQKLQREHGWTEQEVLATIRESTVKPKAEPVKAEKAPEPTRYETLVEIIELIRDTFGDKPFTQREQTKAQEIVLELEVLMGVNV
jgi:hypothetical protein